MVNDMIIWNSYLSFFLLRSIYSSHRKSVGRISRKILCRQSTEHGWLLSYPSAVSCTTVMKDKSICQRRKNWFIRVFSWKIDLQMYPLITSVEKSSMKQDAFQRAHPHRQPDCPIDEKESFWQSYEKKSFSSCSTLSFSYAHAVI